MANTDRPNGLIPVGSYASSPHNGQVQRFFIPASDSTNTFVGDAVKSAGGADADGVATVAQAAATNPILGVIVGIEPLPFTSNTSDNLRNVYRAASTATYVLVNVDPMTEYEIQDDSVGGDLAAVNVGQNADIVVGTGNTTTGKSAMELDASSATTTATLQLKITGLVQRPDNEIGTNARWSVKINNHQLGSHTGTAGV
jgi:hypothetical protein